MVMDLTIWSLEPPFMVHGSIWRTSLALSSYHLYLDLPPLVTSFFCSILIDDLNLELARPLSSATYLHLKLVLTLNS